MTSVHEFRVQTIDGEEKGLGDYRGKALLIVNVASQCGLTPQYARLQKLHEKYGPRGFAVLGFPCNQFGGQEPFSEGEIKKFCETRFGVTFPMFAKIDVNGASAHPLYRYLESQPTAPEGSGDIQWNFGKFLVGKNGNVLARFAPPTDPSGPEIETAIEGALAG